MEKTTTHFVCAVDWLQRCRTRARGVKRWRIMKYNNNHQHFTKLNRRCYHKIRKSMINLLLIRRPYKFGWCTLAKQQHHFAWQSKTDKVRTKREWSESMWQQYNERTKPIKSVNVVFSMLFGSLCFPLFDCTCHWMYSISEISQMKLNYSKFIYLEMVGKKCAALVASSNFPNWCIDMQWSDPSWGEIGFETRKVEFEIRFARAHDIVMNLS